MTGTRNRLLSLAGVAAILAMLGGCAGSLSHLETQRRLDATYAGFPPTFSDASLSRYRAAYLAEKPVFDRDRDVFLGTALPGKACALPEETARALAESSFRLPIHERSPSWSDYMKKHGQGYTGATVDQVSFKLVDGDCTGGTLNGPADIVLSYVRVAGKRISPGNYRVDEVTARERCTYRDSVRDGPCTRHAQYRTWTGRFTGDGRLLPELYARHEEQPEIWPEQDSYPVENITVFDYGTYAGGFESGPGVAFETLPIVGSGVDAQENHTLARTTLPDGRVRYEEYFGGTRKLAYVLRDGIAHGELVWYRPELSNGSPRECFVDGELVLTMKCGS